MIDSLDEILLSAIAAERAARPLRSCPLLAPLPGQLVLFEHALRVARGWLPMPERFGLEWRDGGHDVQHGVTTFDERSGKLLVAMNASLMPYNLLACAHHELAHVADFFDPAMRDLPRIALERRAIRYAARAMGWQ